MAAFKLRILTPDGPVLTEDVDSVVAPGLLGHFGILARHTPLVAALATGILRIASNGRQRLFVVRGGLTEVSADLTTILTEGFIPAADEADAEIALLKIRRQEAATLARQARS